MKIYQVIIVGTAPILQHKFGVDATAELESCSKLNTSGKDYSNTWKDALYYDKLTGKVYQPAIQIERAMVGAAVDFKIPGKRGRTYRDVILGSVFVKPDYLFHQDITRDDFIEAANQGGDHGQVMIDIQPVRVQKARVLRYRPLIKAGWRLQFTIESLDDDLQIQVLKQILELAGNKKGIGDYRPRYGRFMVESFKEDKKF